MRAVGGHGEDIALRHLARAGLALLARNFTCRHGEIDLVMREDDTIVFVEVRYRRRPGRFGDGIDSVGAAKRARLIRAAGAWLQANPALAQRPCRFDVLALAGEPSAPTFDWRRNAFET